jgi:hypothetical protein
MNMLKKYAGEFKPFLPGALVAAALVAVPLMVQFLSGGQS